MSTAVPKLLHISLFFFFSSLLFLRFQLFFFFNDTATTEIYTLSLHDALPIWTCSGRCCAWKTRRANPTLRPFASLSHVSACAEPGWWVIRPMTCAPPSARTSCRSGDRKSTRLNSSHVRISHAVFCLKKNKLHV